jgi:hypothetical protein
MYSLSDMLCAHPQVLNHTDWVPGTLPAQHSTCRHRGGGGGGAPRTSATLTTSTANAHAQTIMHSTHPKASQYVIATFGDSSSEGTLVAEVQLQPVKECCYKSTNMSAVT